MELIKEEWNKLFFLNSLQSPFQTFDYIFHWYKSFASGNQIRIYMAKRGNMTIGFLPLILYSKKKLKILSNLTNDHCFHSEPLVYEGYEDLFQEKIWDNLKRDQDTWDILKLNFSFTFSNLQLFCTKNFLNKTGFHLEKEKKPTYIVSLDKSFDEYFHRDLSPNLQKKFKRCKNKLSKTGKFSVNCFTANEARKHWDEFLEIETSGWKGKLGTSIRELDHSFKYYYEGLVKILAENNALRMYFLELNGKNIAGVFGYIERDVYHWFKTGYDENYKEYSPSHMLLLFIIEDLIKYYPELKILHMFPWDHGYKHRYCNEEGHYTNSIMFNRSLLGKIVNVFFGMYIIMKNMRNLKQKYIS
jgi:CelD/BcsL family acetyltransferase involved in cellulose biosynthesis